MADLGWRERLQGGWHVVRGHALPVDPDALKRAGVVLYRDGLSGSYGEPPPAPATATPLHYLQSEAVHAAIDSFANRISSTALHLFREDRAGELEEVQRHPGLNVLENPNPFLTRTELFWHVAADYKLSGNAYWFLAGPTHGAPTEIWRVNPRETRLIRDARQYISGYVTEIEGELVPLSALETLHYKRPNPFDAFYGIGDLAAAAHAAQTGRDMEEWNRTMFARDYAVPAGLVNIDGMIGDADFERMKTEWRSSYGSKTRRTAFLRGGKVQFQPIGLNQTDVDFLQGSRWEAEKIYRVFGTYHLLPAQFADDRKVNERLFLEEHAWPMLVYLAEVLTDQFFSFWGPKEGPGRLVARFEDIRPRERALDLAEGRQMAQGMFFNEWRIKQGLSPKPGWDDILFIQAAKGVTPPGETPAGVSNETPDEEEPPPPTGEDEQTRAERRESAGDDTGDEHGDFADKALNLDAAHKELAAWQKYTLKRRGIGARPFELTAVPAWLAHLTREALGGCQNEHAVKAAFETAHGLLEGTLPIKASFGPPDGTVVLYLSHVEDVLLIQQALQRAVASDAPVRWTPREHLHVTLVHAPIVDEPAFRDIFQEMAGTFTGFDVHATRVTTFETDGAAVPIVALISPSDDLRALHSDLVAGFSLRGVAVSAYSQPDAWTPHVTLGYIDAAYRDVMGLSFDVGYEFGCWGVTLAFTRGDFEIVQAQTATPPPVTVTPPETEDFPPESLKVIQATRLEFEADFEDVLAAGRRGDINRRTWANRTRTLLQKYAEKAYRDGLTDGGVTIGETEPLRPVDRAAVIRLVASQSQYVTELGRVVFRTDTSISDGQAAIKPDLWFNKSIMPAYQAGRLSADGDGLYLWILNPLKKNCETCLAAAGQVHHLSEWHAAKIIPQGDALYCRGFACGCKHQRATGRPVGRLDTIPRRAIKDGGEDEGAPMIDGWPDSLPDPIQREFTRVLGRRIVAAGVSNETPEPVYSLTLREEPGYYRDHLDDDAAAQGLRMIDERLVLRSHERLDETQVRLTFVVREADEADEATGD